MKEEKSKIKSDILLRVRMLYVLFIAVGAAVFVRLVWVQLFSSEVAYNAGRLESRIFTEQTVPAQLRLDPRARGRAAGRVDVPLSGRMDFGSPGLDSVKLFREQSDSLAKLLAAFFRDKPADAYRRFFRAEHERRYRLVRGRDTTHLRAEGFLARLINSTAGRGYVTRRIYDTIRDHTPVKIFPARWTTTSGRSCANTRY